MCRCEARHQIIRDGFFFFFAFFFPSERFIDARIFHRFFVFFAMAKGEAQARARAGVRVSFFMVFENFCPQDSFCKSGVLLLLLKSECMHACNAQMMQDLRFLRAMYVFVVADDDLHAMSCFGFEARGG